MILSGAKTYIKKYRIEILIFAVALALRFLYLYVSVAHTGGDLVGATQGADGYYEVSQNLINGHGLTQSQSPPYIPYSFRPPLFFYFLYWTQSLFGYGGVVLLNMIISSALPVMAMKLVSYVLDSRKWIVAIGFLLAVEPQGIMYATFLYSETLFMFLLFASFLYLFKYIKEKQLHNLIISGAVLGLACLTKPVVEYFPVIIIGCLLWEARKRLSREIFLHIGAYVLVFLAAIAPWIYRNYVVFGVPSLSPQLGVNLYTQLLPSVLSVEHGTTWQQEFDALASTEVQGPNIADITKGGPYEQRAIPALLENKKGLAIVSANSVFAFFTMDGILDVLRHIGQATPLRLGKPALFVLLSSPGMLLGLIIKVSTTPTIFVLFGRIFWILVTGLFFFGAWRYLRQKPLNPAALIMALTVLYFAFTTIVAGFGITARYRLPINIFILIFASYAVSVLAFAAHRRLRKKNA